MDQITWCFFAGILSWGRWARSVHILPGVFRGEVRDTHIAQLELVMVLGAFMEFAEVLKSARRMWIVDNTAALHTLVKGVATNQI